MVIIKRRGDNLPSGYVLGSVAEESDVIEDLAHGAAHLLRVLAVNAHVEEPAVVGLQVTGVVQLLAVGVDLGVVGAGEAIGENLCGTRTWVLEEGSSAYRSRYVQQPCFSLVKAGMSKRLHMMVSVLRHAGRTLQNKSPLALLIPALQIRYT